MREYTATPFTSKKAPDAIRVVAQPSEITITLDSGLTPTVSPSVRG